MRMSAKTPRQNLDLYPTMDQRQMKVIDVDYSVRMGYWASRSDMQEYKVYAIVIWMFDLDFFEHLATSSWEPSMVSITNKPKSHDSFITPTRIHVGDEQSGLMFIVRSPSKNGQKMKTIEMVMSMKCLFKNMMQTMTHW
jgi:hypothetical protein